MCLVIDFILSSHLEVFNSPSAMLQSYSSKDPKLILAVPLSLSYGASRTIFSEFAAVEDNVVLLTSRGEEGTLCRAMFEMWNGQQREDDKWEKGKLGRNVMMDETKILTVSHYSSFASVYDSYKLSDEIQSATSREGARRTPGK